MRSILLGLTVFFAACSERSVTVRIVIPNEAGVDTPLSGIVLSFLPYDRDSVLASLEARALSPRPHSGELDSLYRAFQEPYLTFVRLSATVDRLRAESARLKGGAAASADSNGRLTAIGDSLARLTPELDRARAALAAARVRYWPVIDSLRKTVKQWESSAYSGYDTLVRQLPGRRFSTPVSDTTDAEGWGRAELTDNEWWVSGRSIDPSDPNAEWYWNVRIQADTVILDSRTGRKRPRY